MLFLVAISCRIAISNSRRTHKTISQWQRGSTCLRAKTEEQMQHNRSSHFSQRQNMLHKFITQNTHFLLTLTIFSPTQHHSKTKFSQRHHMHIYKNNFPGYQHSLHQMHICDLLFFSTLPIPYTHSTSSLIASSIVVSTPSFHHSQFVLFFFHCVNFLFRHIAQLFHTCCVRHLRLINFHPVFSISL